MVRVAYQSYERDKRFAGGVLAGGLSYRLFLFCSPSLPSVTARRRRGRLGRRAIRRGSNAGLSASLAASVGAAVNTSDRGLFLILGAAIVLTLASGIGVIKTMRLYKCHCLAGGPRPYAPPAFRIGDSRRRTHRAHDVRALLLQISAGPLTETILIAVELL